MFNLFKKEKSQQAIQIRDTLFGDVPISEWVKDDSLQTQPWHSFIQVKHQLSKKDNAGAIDILQKIIDMPELESRHYLQAWHSLRQLGVNPPTDKAKTVYGVVVEVGMKNGADIVAAYADYTARYLNHTGAGVIWEKPDSSLDAEIEILLKAGQVVANQIGPWEQTRPPIPKADNVRLNMLTPSGLHFGYGGFITLSNEQMGKAILDPATQLMQSLTKKK